MSDSINVFCAITAKNGERTNVEISKSSTSTQVRQKVSEATKIPMDQLRLIFRGKMIKDDDSAKAVETHKLEPDCVLHCMGKPSESSSSASAPAPSPAVATTTTTTANATPNNSSSTTTTAAVPSIPPAAAAAAAAAASAVTPAAATATSNDDPLKSALQTLRTSNSASTYETAVSTLAKILSNITDHPMEEKYRKVKKQNAAFQKRLGGLTGGDAAMKAVGFVVEEQEEHVPVYQLHASAEAWPKLMASKATVDAAAAEAKRALNTPPPPQSAGGVPNMFSGMMGNTGTGAGMGGAPNPFAAMGGMAAGAGGGGTGGGNQDAAMRSAMTNMMSNPEALRSMLQNPMVQQMIENDPNVPPMLRTSMQQLANNPAMLNQLSTLMNDPATRARLEGMMANGGGGMPGMMGGGAGGGMPGMMGGMPGMMGGGAGGGMPGMMPPQGQANNSNNSAGTAGNTNTNNGSGNGSEGNDQGQTEDEMIAEAIRRSLEES